MALNPAVFGAKATVRGQSTARCCSYTGILPGISIFLLVGLAACSGQQKELSRQYSPNGTLVAVLMESQLRDAAGSIQEDIYLNDRSLPIDLNKPVFSGVGCDRVPFKWVNDYTLEIHYETTCAIAHFTNRWDRPSNVAAGRPNPIEITLVRGEVDSLAWSAHAADGKLVVLSARPKPEDTALADGADDGAFAAAVAKALH